MEPEPQLAKTEIQPRPPNNGTKPQPASIFADLKARVKRHPKAFKITGALMVLLTFTVKEAFRDSVKDDVSELEAASSALTIEDGVEVTQLNMWNFVAKEHQKDLGRFDVFFDYFVHLEEAVDVANQRFALFRKLLKQLELPEPKDFEKDKKDFDQMNRMNNLAKRYDPRYSSGGPKRPTWAEVDVLVTIGQLEEGAAKPTADALASYVKKAIDERTEQKKRSLTYLNISAIVLSFFGGLIGIVGILTDVETEKPE